MDHGKWKRLVREFPAVGILSEMFTCTAWWHKVESHVATSEIKIARVDKNLLMRIFVQYEHEGLGCEDFHNESIWAVLKDGRITEVAVVPKKTGNLWKERSEGRPFIESLVKVEWLNQLRYFIQVTIESSDGAGHMCSREFVVYKPPMKFNLAAETAIYSIRESIPIS